MYRQWRWMGTPLSLPRQLLAARQRREGHDDDGAVLAVGEVHGDGAVEELAEAPPESGLAGADDDVAGVDLVGEAGQRPGGVAGELFERVADALRFEQGADVRGELRIEGRLLDFGQVGVVRAGRRRCRRRSWRRGSG